jgi:hypothetical protein
MHAFIHFIIFSSIHSIGVVIAVKGSVDDAGVFSVSDWTFCYAVTPTPTPPTASTTEANDHHQHDHHQHDHHQHDHHQHHTAKSTYLLFVSGIEIGNITTSSTATTTADDDDDDDNKPPVLPPVSSSSSELSVQLLIDYVAGRLPSQSAIDLDIASKIVR